MVEHAFTAEDGYADVCQFEIEKFGYEVICLTEEGSLQMLSQDASQNKVQDILKRDEETFYSFEVSPDQRFLVTQSVILQYEERKIEKKAAKAKKKTQKKSQAGDSDDDYEMVWVNKHVVYLWEHSGNGEFRLRDQQEFDTLGENHDYFASIQTLELGEKPNQFLAIGVTKRTRSLYSYIINDGRLQAYDEPFEVKKQGVVKSFNKSPDGFYCLGGDHHIPYIRIREMTQMNNTVAQKPKPIVVESDDSSPKNKKTVGALSVGISRKKIMKKFL